SFRRWRLVPGMARRLLGSFRMILAQDEEAGARIGALGAARVRFAGNLKALVEAPGCDAAELAAIRAGLGTRPAWLAASTHAGEEEAVIAAHRALRAAMSSGAPPLSGQRPDTSGGDRAPHGARSAGAVASLPASPGRAEEAAGVVSGAPRAVASLAVSADHVLALGSPSADLDADDFRPARSAAGVPLGAGDSV